MLTCMYCGKLVIHSNQIKLPMASSVDYIMLLMYWYTKCQKYSYHASLELISHHLPWKRRLT